LPSIFHPGHPDHVPRAIRRGETRWMLGRNIWTGVLGNIGLVYMTGGVFFVAYAHEMGMQKYHFGVLRTIGSLMVPLMLLSPAIEERFGRRKYPWFMLHMAGRLSLAPLLLAVYARFSARRTFWIKLTGMLFFLGAAGLVGVTRSGTAARRELLSAIFVLLFAFGLADLLFHVRIPEPPRKAPPARATSKFLDALRSRPLRNWLFAAALWNLAISIGGPFCMPYMMKELGFGDRLFLASVLTSLVPTLGSLATLRLWGKLLDTRPPGPIVAGCCAVWALIPLLFYYATPSNALWMMALVWGISGVFPTAVTLAMPLITARLAGVEKTAPAALRLVGMSLGTALGSAAGTLIVHAYSVQHAFVASFAARLTVAALMLLLVRVRPAHAERAEVRATLASRRSG